MATCKLIQDPALCKDRIEADDGKWALAFARIEWLALTLYIDFWYVSLTTI